MEEILLGYGPVVLFALAGAALGIILSNSIRLLVTKLLLRRVSTPDRYERMYRNIIFGSLIQFPIFIGIGLLLKTNVPVSIAMLAFSVLLGFLFIAATLAQDSPVLVRYRSQYRHYKMAREGGIDEVFDHPKGSSL